MTLSSAAAESFMVKKSFLETTRLPSEVNLEPSPLVDPEHGSSSPSGERPPFPLSDPAVFLPIQRMPAPLPAGPPRVTEGLKLSAAQIAHRFGISGRTFERWLLNPELRFPRPIYILRRRYWELAEVQVWERRQATISASRPRFLMNSA
jgi:hypothetical protein